MDSFRSYQNTIWCQNWAPSLFLTKCNTCLVYGCLYFCFALIRQEEKQEKPLQGWWRCWDTWKTLGHQSHSKVPQAPYHLFPPHSLHPLRMRGRKERGKMRRPEGMKSTSDTEVNMGCKNDLSLRSVIIKMLLYYCYSLDILFPTEVFSSQSHQSDSILMPAFIWLVSIETPACHSFPARLLLTFLHSRLRTIVNLASHWPAWSAWFMMSCLFPDERHFQLNPCVCCTEIGFITHLFELLFKRDSLGLWTCVVI